MIRPPCEQDIERCDILEHGRKWKLGSSASIQIGLENAVSAALITARSTLAPPQHAGRLGGRAVAFDCSSQEKAAHGHVVCAVQEVSKQCQRGPKTAAIVPEMSSGL
jgi:hypothetical protein